MKKKNHWKCVGDGKEALGKMSACTDAKCLDPPTTDKKLYYNTI